MSADEPAHDGGPSNYPPPPRTPDIDPLIAEAAAAAAAAATANEAAHAVAREPPQGEKRPRSRGEEGAGGGLRYAQDHHHHHRNHPPTLGDGGTYEEERKRRREVQRGVYTRTGQACDRCKARKIKCDALPGGCSPCATAGVECYVTDRVSGRTERRGYLQDLERERESMVGYIRDLERVIAETTSLRVRPSPWTASRGGGPEDTDTLLPEEVAGKWEQVGAVLVRR